MSNRLSFFLAIAFTTLAIVCKLKFVPLETNFALFGAVSIFCGAYLRGTAAWIVPLLGLAASDFLGEWLNVPGVYRYDVRSMLFNYIGFASMIGIGHFLRRRDSIEYVAGTTLAGSLLFFLISNFGSWLDPLLNYERSWNGLMQCYWMGIYFFRNTLISDLAFTMLFFVIHRFVLAYAAKRANVSHEA